MPRKRQEYGAHLATAMMMSGSTDLYGAGNPYGYNGPHDHDDGPRMSASEIEAANLAQEVKIEAARLKRLKKNSKRLKNRQ